MLSSRTFLHSLAFLLAFVSAGDIASAETKYFHFKVHYTSVTRLCHTKALVAVNGQYPGPTQYVTEGDRVIVKVTNLVSYNVTIHWHGVRQLLSGWADGPAYITQCPLQTNQSYVHKFRIVGQRGTLFWHAHFSWLRATVHGAFVIQKKPKDKYPFLSNPYESLHELPPILIGEWWNANVEDVIKQALASGASYNISNAITINGQPGDLYNCSKSGTVVYNVQKGQTVLLRIINAAVNFHMYFSVAQHSLTVVEADATYTEPYTTDVVLLAPGQTLNVLLTANQPVGKYYMAATVFSEPLYLFVPYPRTPATAILNYEGSSSSATIPFPSFPLANDSAFLANFTRSLKGDKHMDLPEKVDVDLLDTVGYALQPCPPGRICHGINGTYLRTTFSNITFVTPKVALLQAYFYHLNGIYTPNFPDIPLLQYNYTGVDPPNRAALPGTRVKVLPFGSIVQVVYQDTATLLLETHPIHLHGHNFYIVGTGHGTYNPKTDPAKFNLKNPVMRNTVSVPLGGWAAVRFRANNPGVWFVHCHFDMHTEWGMQMAYITLNGKGPKQSLPPPPKDLPKC